MLARVAKLIGTAQPLNYEKSSRILPIFINDDCLSSEDLELVVIKTLEYLSRIYIILIDKPEAIIKKIQYKDKSDAEIEKQISNSLEKWLSLNVPIVKKLKKPIIICS